MTSLLSISDLSPEGLGEVMKLSRAPVEGASLLGKGVAMVFEHPSARTRNACEMAVVDLGGHPVAIMGAEIGLDSRETAEDVARTLSCYHRVIAARVARHATLERMALALDASGRGVPLVNLLSDVEHPTEAVADLLTMERHLGSLEGRTVTYLGDANNVCRSLVFAASLARMRARVASPPGYGLSPHDIATAARLGSRPEVFESPLEASKGADVLYTDVWASMGQEAERSARLEAFAGYTLDESLVAVASPEAIVMHCLPAHRGEEISAGVLDGERSVVWEQAADRRHALRGILRYLLGERPA